MEELVELRTFIGQGRYTDALLLVDEMEAMSRRDTVNRVRSFITVLLIHLIKQRAEQRTTRSWDISIRNALREIEYVNKRERSGGHYLTKAELQELIAEALGAALDYASLESFGGVYDAEELALKVDMDAIAADALRMILSGQS